MKNSFDKVALHKSILAWTLTFNYCTVWPLSLFFCNKANESTELLQYCVVWPRVSQCVCALWKEEGTRWRNRNIKIETEREKKERDKEKKREQNR